MAEDKPEKSVTIIVDGTPHRVESDPVTYAEVVTLAYPDYPHHPEINYSGKVQASGPAAITRASSRPAAPFLLRKAWSSMLRKLANHNDDIRRLLEKGYALKLDSSYLVVRDVPYLDHEKRLKNGAIVTKLVFVDQERIGPQEDHQVFFAGSPPHNTDGTPIRNLSDRAATLTLADTGIVVARQFSNKPAGGFTNLFDKIESYATIICGPAECLHKASPLRFAWTRPRFPARSSSSRTRSSAAPRSATLRRSSKTTLSP